MSKLTPEKPSPDDLAALALSSYYVLCAAEACSNLGRFDGVRYGRRPSGPSSFDALIAKARGEGFGPEVKRRILLGAFVLSAGYRRDLYACIHRAGQPGRIASHFGALRIHTRRPPPGAADHGAEAGGGAHAGSGRRL